jgi:hypothetical protein
LVGQAGEAFRAAAFDAQKIPLRRRRAFVIHAAASFSRRTHFQSFIQPD